MPGTDPTAVRLQCDDLRAVPLALPPPGYALRAYRPGDEAAWVAIHRLADQFNPASPALFARQFGEAPEELPHRQLFLLNPAGEPVGTATAWFGTDRHGAGLGRVHWVAIVPAEQGRGLAKPLLSAVCRRLLELGHRQAYLTTSTRRVPALNLYVVCGFLPDLTSPADRAAWAALMASRADGESPSLRPALAQWLKAHLPTQA